MKLLIKGLKGILLIGCMCICIFIFGAKIVHAEEYSGSNADNNAYENNNGAVIFPKGCRSRWSGFLIYIVDEAATLKSDIKVVTSFDSMPEYSEPIIETRLGGGSISLDSCYIYRSVLWGYPPFDSAGNACGGKIRDWMLMANDGTGYNMYSVLELYFAEDNAEIIRQFIENEWYLIVEPFFWFMYYDGYEATGVYICDTARGIAETEDYINSIKGLSGTDSLYGPKNFRRYTNNNYPNCCRFSKSQFGVPVINEAGGIKSGLLTNAEIMLNGYGIMSFWAGDIDDTDTNDETTTSVKTDEYEYAVDEELYISDAAAINRDALYTIMNKAVNTEYDLSLGILPGEYVTNSFEAYPVFFNMAAEKLGIIKRCVTRKESAVYTYIWPNMVQIESGSYWVSDWQLCTACSGSGFNVSEEKYERKVCNNCGITVKSDEWGKICASCNGTGELRDAEHWHEGGFAECDGCDGKGYVESGVNYYREICQNPACDYVKCYEYGYTADSWGSLCYACNGNPFMGVTPIKDKSCTGCNGKGYTCYDCNAGMNYSVISCSDRINCNVCLGSGYGEVKKAGYYADCVTCRGTGKIYDSSSSYYICNKCGGKNPVFSEKECSNLKCDEGWIHIPASEEQCEECGGTGEINEWHDPCDALRCEGGKIVIEAHDERCPYCKGSGTETYHTLTCDGSTKSLIVPREVDCSEKDCNNGKTSVWIEPEYYDCTNTECEDGKVNGMPYSMYKCNGCGYFSKLLYSTNYETGLYEECYTCYGSGIYGTIGGEEIYCQICDGIGRICDGCCYGGYGCIVIEPDYERHGCLECGGDFFCTINGSRYCDGNHADSCYGAGLMLPLVEIPGYYDKCTVCMESGVLDVCNNCGSLDYSLLHAGSYSSVCSVCAGNADSGHLGMIDRGYEKKLYEEVQDEDKPYIRKDEIISVIASLEYQYIDNIELYKLISFEVFNDAIENKGFDYSELCMPQILASVSIYLGDNAEFKRPRIEAKLGNSTGIIASEESHYKFADLKDAVIECASEEEYLSRLANDKKKAAEYIYDGSWSRNDALTVNVGDYDYEFMSDDIVKGCIIADKEYVKSAAKSEYAYGQTGIDITNFAPVKLGGKQVKTVTGDGGKIYKTGIKASYEAIAGQKGEVIMHSGKGIFDDADNIYNHVFKPDGYGSNHNGEDPVDGYHIAVKALIDPAIDILDNNLKMQTEPSSQLVTVLKDAERYLTLDSYYYIRIFNNISEEACVKKKLVRFPFTVYYDGEYYVKQSDGYTEWIEVETPVSYSDNWETGADAGSYESSNHWQMMPVYVPTWADVTDLRGKAQNVTLKVIDRNDKVYQCDIAVQLSGVIYGFAVTGISDAGQYYGFDSDKEAYELDYSAASEKLEWIVGVRNRFGNYAVRNLMDGSIADMADKYRALPLGKGSGEGTDLTKTGNGEPAKGTTFNYVIRTIDKSDLSNGYIEIVPSFKYVMPDGEIIGHDKLMVIYNVEDSYIIAGSEAEKKLFEKYASYGNDIYGKCSSVLAPAIGDLRFKDAYYDKEDISEYHFGDWLSYMAEVFNMDSLSDKTITVNDILKRRYFTNLFGCVRIPSGLCVYSGEYEQLGINQFNEKASLVSAKDLNNDGFEDVGFLEDEFRKSMQMWFGSYKIWDEFYCIDKSAYQEFNYDGLPIRPGMDSGVLKGGRLIIGFDIILYRDNIPYLCYGDMWKTEGQKLFYDNVEIEYGDIAVVDTNKTISDNWDAGSFIIN